MREFIRILLLITLIPLICSCNPEAHDGIVTVSVSVESEKSLQSVEPVFVPASTYVYKAVPATGNTETHGYAPEWTESGSTETATLSFKLAGGIWHLTVGLKDISGNLVYESETMIVNVSPANKALSVVLYPSSTGTGSVSVNISVIAATDGGTCICYYKGEDGIERNTTLSVGSHSAGESAIITGTIPSLECGFYTFRFIFRETKGSTLYGSGDAASVLVMAGLTSNITGDLGSSMEIRT